MAFLNPKDIEEDDALPGSGLQLDLEVTVCPQCGREAGPWQKTCPDCEVATVGRTEIEPPRFELPDLDDDLDDGTGDGTGTGD